MTATPIEFTRNSQEPRERCGNRVRLEDANGNLIGGTTPIQVTDVWELFLRSSVNINDSDKTLTVPAGYEWQVLWIFVRYASTGDAGNRQLEIQLLDDSNNLIGDFRAGATQAASLVRQYMFAPALADLTAFRDTDYLMTPLPPTTFLPAGYSVRVFDNNAVAVAGDDLIIRMMVARRVVT